jgi:hypothetical protein
VKLFSLGVYHQNFCVVIFVLYFFTLWSRHCKTYGLTHRITNCSQWSHVFPCCNPSPPSGSKKLCLHAFELGTIAWHICGYCKSFPYLLLHSVVCPLPFDTCQRCPHVLTNAKLLCSGNMAWHPRRWLTKRFVNGIGAAVSV